MSLKVYRLGKNGVLAVCTALIYLSLLGLWTDANPLYLQTICSLLTLLVVPGTLLLANFGIRTERFSEQLLYSVGLSLVYVMYLAFLLNIIGPVLGIERPLAEAPIYATMGVSLLALVLITFLRPVPLVFEFRAAPLDMLNTIMMLSPAAILVVGILGTQILNAGGSNTMVMIALCLIAYYVLVLAILNAHIRPVVYPFAIMCIALTMLFLTALRSKYIIGWDVNIEFQVFGQTLRQGYWSVANSTTSSYNAMLSITMLPTVLFTYLKIGSQALYKVVFSLIACLIPLACFVFFNRYGKEIIAFLAAFFVVAQAQFGAELPGLARQEIGLLFFALLLMVCFSRSLPEIQRHLLAILFGVGMVVSHYSTTYIAFGLLFCVYGGMLVFSWTRRIGFMRRLYERLNIERKQDAGIQAKPRTAHLFVSPVVIAGLFLFSFLWYAQVTDTAGSLVTVSKNVMDNIPNLFNSDLKSDSARRALWDSSFTGEYTAQEVNTYVENKEEELRIRHEGAFLAPPYQNRVTQVATTAIPVKSSALKKGVELGHEIVKKIIKLLLLVGVLYLIFFEFKHEDIDKEFILLNLACLGAIAAMITLPLLSVHYNLSRLYLQCLFIIGFAVVVGISFSMRWSSERWAMLAAAVLIVAYFIPYTGLTTQFVGGRPEVQLNNFGPDYERFYLHDNEKAAIAWVSTRAAVDRRAIFTDTHAHLRFEAFGLPDLNVVEGVLPGSIFKGAYVYAGYRNTVTGVATLDGRPVLNNDVVNYRFPSEFLDRTADKVYSSGTAEVYR